MDAELAQKFPGYDSVPIGIGRSGDTVRRLVAPGRAPLIAKIAVAPRTEDLRGEVERLRWLGARGVPVPDIVEVVDLPNGLVLVMTCLPGVDMATSAAPPSLKVDRLGAALAMLHAIPPETCPFDETVPARLARARIRLAGGLVDEGDFDADRTGRNATDLLDEVA